MREFLSFPGIANLTHLALKAGLAMAGFATCGYGLPAETAKPEWEATARLRYAPPTLVAPTIVAVPPNFFRSNFAPDEDVILELPANKTRLRKLMFQGGRNVRIIGGDMGMGDLQPEAMTRSLFIEGLKFDQSIGLPLVSGCPVDVDGKQEHDAIHVVGVAMGTRAAPDVYVQNCFFSGIHGTNRKHTAGVRVKSAAWSQGALHLVTLADHGLAVDQSFICGPTTEPILNRTYIVTTVLSPTEVVAKIRRKFGPPLTEGLAGSGGYIWPLLPESGVHADCYQCNDSSIQNIIRFYKVTMEVGYQGFIGGHNFRDAQARGLVMTRVNTRMNDVWPHDDNSMALFIGDADQDGTKPDSANGRLEPFPVEFDRVFVRPRPGWTLFNTVYPGAALATRGTVDVSAFSDDGGRSIGWQKALGVTGKVTLSENGFGENGKDYADLSGPNAPGLNYRSPGYSAEAITPLVMKAITAFPEHPSLTANATAGAQVARLDVEFTGAGHIIDLSLVDDAGGRFVLKGRNLVSSGTGALDEKSYSITVRAGQAGNPVNAITRKLVIGGAD